MQKQISAIISLKDKFSQPLLKMSDNVKKLDQGTRSSMNRVNRWGKQVEKSVDRALKSTAKWAKRGALVAGAWSLKSGIDGIVEIDDATRKVMSIAKDRLDMGETRDLIKSISYDFGVEVEKVGNTLYEAISSSVPIDQLEEVTILAHKLSRAGFTDIESAMKLIATTGNAFNLETSEEFQNMADQFLQAQNLGVILVGDMAHHYGSINTLSKSIGASLEEQNSAIATMTMMGMTPSEAITSYKNILNAFLKPVSDTTAATLESLGLGRDFLTAKNFKELGFGPAMKKVMDATKGDLDLISKIFRDIRGKTGATIFSGEGLSEYERIFKEISDPTGALDEAFETVEGSISRQWEIFKNKIGLLNTEFYESGEFGTIISDSLEKANKWLDDNKETILKKIDEISKKVVNGIKDVFDTIRDNKDVIKLVIQFFATIYALIKISKGIKKFSEGLGDIKAVLDSMKLGDIVAGLGLGKLALIAVGIILVAKAFKYLYDNWGDIREEYPAIDNMSKALEKFFEFLNSVDFTKLGDKFNWVKEIISTILEEIVTTIADWVVSILSIVSGLIQVFVGLFQIIEGFIEGLVTGDFGRMLEGFENVSEGMSSAWQGFTGIFTTVVDSKINIADTVFYEKVEGMRRAWERFKNFLQAPVTATVNFLKNNSSQKPSRKEGIAEKYKGTPSWKGGIVKVHERGGEIMDLPRGTRIYPHDRSVNMAFEEGANLNGSNGNSGGIYVDLGGVHFNGDIRTDGDINEIGTKIVRVIKKELANI